MKFKLQLLAVGIILANGISAQTLSPSAISSAGGFNSGAAGMLSFTVAEMAMVETFSSGGVILTQGFQQPEDFSVSIKDEIQRGEEIIAGPNPTHGIVRIYFVSPHQQKFAMTIYDANGKALWNSAIEMTDKNNFLSLDLSSFAAGDYFLKGIKSGEDAASFSQKITVIK